ncbi:hypothetical protein D9M71_747850 [compost metagenome]
MTELAQARPVLRIPEQPPRRFDAGRVTAVFGVLQLGRDLVVDNRRLYWPLISRAHRAIGILT